MKGQTCWLFAVVCQVFLGLLIYVCICLNYVQLCNLAADTLHRADLTLIQTFTIFKREHKTEFLV